MGCSNIPAIISKIKRCPNVRARASVLARIFNQHPIFRSSQLRSLWLCHNDIGLHGLIMIADFIASVRACNQTPITIFFFISSLLCFSLYFSSSARSRLLHLQDARDEAAGDNFSLSLIDLRVLTLLSQPRGWNIMPELAPAKRDDASVKSTPRLQNEAAARTKEAAVRASIETEARLPHVCRLGACSWFSRP